MAETEEYKALRELVPQLRDAVKPHLVPLSGHLFAKGLITEPQETELRNEYKSKESRAAELVSMVMNKVKLDTTNLQVFFHILRKYGIQNVDDFSEVKLEPKSKQKTPSSVAEVSEYAAISSTGTQTLSANQMQHTLAVECDCRICTSKLKQSSAVVTFSLLNSNKRQKEDYEYQLQRETKKIMMQFHGVESGLYNTVCDKVDIETLKFHLNAAKASQSEQIEGSIFSSYEDQLKAAKTAPAIFSIVCKFWSFIDYELLEHLIEFLGNEDDKKRMEKYRKNFDQYAR